MKMDKENRQPQYTTEINRTKNSNNVDCAQTQKGVTNIIDTIHKTIARTPPRSTTYVLRTDLKYGIVSRLF